MMDINRSFTHQELMDALEKLKPKHIIYANENMYAVIVNALGYEPENLIVNNFVSDDQVVVVDREMLKHSVINPLK